MNHRKSGNEISCELRDKLQQKHSCREIGSSFHDKHNPFCLLLALSLPKAEAIELSVNKLSYAYQENPA